MKEEHFGPQISLLHILIKRTLERNCAQFGLSSIQSQILVFVDFESKKREVCQKDIEERFKIRKSSVSSVIDTMEKNGLLERVASAKDSRSKKLVLTEKGEAIHNQMRDLVDEFDSRLEAVLSKEEKEQFLSSVRKLQSFLISEDKEDI